MGYNFEVHEHSVKSAEELEAKKSIRKNRIWNPTIGWKKWVKELHFCSG